MVSSFSRMQEGTVKLCSVKIFLSGMGSNI